MPGIDFLIIRLCPLHPFSFFARLHWRLTIKEKSPLAMCQMTQKILTVPTTAMLALASDES